jgi:hypothetical protein
VTRAGETRGMQEQDLIDRIASALPAEVQADYYREMRHCRSLPENDEMLRILRAMQFLTLLIRQAPDRVAQERLKLDKGLTDCTGALERIRERLDGLPDEVAGAISPPAIAATINESLRQQFVASTIPQTGEALAVAAVKLQQAVKEFDRAAVRINSSHSSAAAEAERAVRDIESAVHTAAQTARSAAAELSSGFLCEYRWSVIVLCLLALLLGAGIDRLLR